MGAQAGHLCFHFWRPRSAAGVLALLFLPATSVILLCGRLSSHGPSLVTGLLSNLAYLVGLTISVVLYRLSPFHPLARYPGPLICRVSRLWAWYIARSGYQHKYSHYLHQRYGPVVRSGAAYLFLPCLSLLTPSLRLGSLAHSGS